MISDSEYASLTSSDLSNSTATFLISMYFDISFDLNYSIEGYSTPNYPFYAETQGSARIDFTLDNNYLYNLGIRHQSTTYDIIFDESDTVFRNQSMLTYYEGKNTVSFTVYKSGINSSPNFLSTCKLRVKCLFVATRNGFGQIIDTASGFRGIPKATVSTTIRYGTCTVRPLSDFIPVSEEVQNIENALINESAAGAIIDQANQEFVQDAAKLESNQAVLENAADASVEAVDMDQINLIDTYSQSVSFWGQLIGQLPTVLGSLWYVFIFGLLIAFVLFVLRIRR